MAIRILSDQNVTSNVIAIQAFRLGTDSLWKIRGNAASTELAFEYSTSSSLSDANIKVVFNSSGCVGIGETSPQQSLDTTGKIRVRDGGNSTIPSIQMGASGVDGLSLPITNTIAFITNSAERMRITSGGEIQFTGNGVIRNEISDGNYSYWYQSASEVRFAAQYAQALTFYNSGAERMRIDSNGNVGVGSGTPLYLLGDQDIGQIAVNRVPSTGVITDTSRSAAYINLNASDGGSSLTFHTANANNLAPTTRMRINSSGDVGIGTIPETAGATWRTLFVGASATIVSRQSAGGYDSIFANNYYVNSSNQDRVRTTGPSSRMFLDGNNIRFQISPSTGVGGAPSWGEIMRIDDSGNVGIGTTLPGRKLTVTGDVSGDANNLLLVNENDTDGDSASIGFSMLSTNTYVKAGIFFKRTTTQGRGELILAVNNEVNGNNVTLSDSRLTINNLGDAYFYREIFAAATTGTRMRVPRNLFVSYGGSSYDYTFDPVALFGSNQSGGTLGLRVSGWPKRLFDGIIIWQNNGGGSSKIGTGSVTLVQVATNDFSGVGVTVSLPSVNTNEIKISFSGFHSNDHGWECYIKTEY